MQIVIDLPEKIYKRIAVTPRCASTFDAIEDRDAFVKAVQKGTPFPKDVTNGDVIKALFSKDIADVIKNRMISDWWNEPYNEVSE